ncbi:hypothetical protein INT47_009114 [Mucor saturninus]|uniref:JmjC domain-containing protein n=1 Tax=Mucor saturninus TaxID=64648 RepID=A0A8H7VAM7_9FUNG|nr:hypothetical protein INT47_009114 [Mucor saturninus]
MRAKGLTDYCNENIMQYHFSNVPVHWRRMLMDSGLVTVLIQLGSLDERVTEAQVQDIVGDLDTCCVISGSPGPDRRWISNLILDELQTWLTNQRSGTTKEPAYEKVARSSTKVTLTYPIQRLPEPPSFEWFLQHCNRDIPTPFIMPKGVIEHWPAFNEHPWSSMDYLLSVAADRIVPVEIGSQYTDADWGQKMMRFSDFIQHHIMKDDIAYLAQHDVFYQIPRLEKDIIVPDYCYIEPRLTELYRCRTNNQILKNAWFGPKGTISPLHQDPYHNLLAQVVGSKYIRLISPVNTSFVYPRDGLMSNTSQVDVENPNHAIYPRFKEADYFECVLEEGEILYIPPKWWHYVRSLETSFSVSLWF